MPVSLVLKRNNQSLLFCSSEYFKFICFVESVYLDKLTLEILVGHHEGNIIQIIKSFILGSDIVLKKINGLYSNDENVYLTKETVLILKYIMDRYANIRGTYFVKLLSSAQKCIISNPNKSIEHSCEFKSGCEI